MTPRELVLAALAGRPVPRVPVGPLAVHFCAARLGVPLEQYTLDARVLADCVAQYHARFRPDAVWVSADTWVTAEALGAAVAFPGPGQPMAGTGEPTVRTPADLDRLPPPGLRGRQPLLVEAVRRVRQAVGPDVCLVACFDQYPFSLACALLGMSEAMVQAASAPALVEAVMHRACAHVEAYAAALAEAGADVLSGGDAPAGLLGPRLYRRLAWPYERRVIEHIQARTGKPVSLHVCGRATPILADMARTGADVLEVDQGVDLGQAARNVGPKVALWGNLDPVAVLARGTPEEVRAAAEAAVAALRAAGRRRFVLSSGCTLAVETPEANLDALAAQGGEILPPEW